MLSRLRSLWRNLIHRHAADRELRDELEAMHALLVDERVGAGMEVEAARRAATIQLGHVHILEAHVRDARAGALWDAVAQDVRYGARLLRRNPLFTLTASLSLAICLGANTAVFTLANRLLFRDHVGVTDPGRLVDIAPTDGRKLIQPALRHRTYEELRARATLIDVYGYALELDLLTFGAAAAVLSLVGVIACYVPARRATRISAVEALRYE